MYASRQRICDTQEIYLATSSLTPDANLSLLDSTLYPRHMSSDLQSTLELLRMNDYISRTVFRTSDP